MTRGTLVGGFLVGLAILQIGLRQSWVHPPASGPMVGDTLPFVPLERLEGDSRTDLSSFTDASDGCDVIVLMSAYCSHCARMRYTWPEMYRNWTDSVGVPVSAIWVLRQDSAVAARFMEGFDIAGARVATLSERAERSWRTRLGVVGTPISYLVDGQGVVRASAMGPRLPGASRVQELCISDPD